MEARTNGPEGFIRNDDGTITRILSKPIQTTIRPADGPERKESIAEVTMRDPAVRDLYVMDAVAGDNRKTGVLVAHLTGLAMSQVSKLPRRDFNVLGNQTSGFSPGRARLRRNDDGTVTAFLSKPLTAADQPPVGELLIREPLAGDTFAADDVDGEVHKAAVLLEKISGVSLEHIESMGAGDFTVVGGLTQGF